MSLIGASAPALAAGSVPAASLVAAPGEPPRDSVLMFVASWCAPCLAELARFEALEAAARPRRLLIVALDEGAGSTEMTRRFDGRQKLAISPREGWELLRRASAGRAAGLPYAVMTDETGRPCALRDRGLSEAELRTMAAACKG
ncbi:MULTISPECIES: thioredoxin domain-containing protein [Novosphingobium]|uniref:hypothetical protein n=2 Tax=Novosphingobium sp. ST904 TaxID=1684385 RepID=UPI0006C896FF|nr:hypothetical protein [Novosphingobium sp. ST904]